MSRIFNVLEEGLRISNFLRMSFLHIPFFHRHRNLLDLRVDRSVLSALFFKDYNRYFVSVSMFKSVECTTFVRNVFSDFPCIKRYWNMTRVSTFSHLSKSHYLGSRNGNLNENTTKRDCFYD